MTNRQPTVLAEALESRRLLAAVSWDGGGDGTNWTDRFNWSGDALPGAADDVTINVAGSPTIRLAGNAAAGSLTVDEAFNFVSGSLATTTAAFNSGLTWSGGSLSGNVTLAGGQTATFNTTAVKRFYTNTLTSNGTVNYDGSGFELYGGGTFSNVGTFNLTGAGGISKSSSSAGGTFNNVGTFNKTTGTTASTITGVGLNNSGTLNITAGGLTLASGGETTVPINVPASGTLTFSGGTFNLDAGGTVLEGAGTIVQANGLVQLNQPAARLNNYTMDGGALTAAAGTVLTLGGNFNFSAGTISNTIVIATGTQTNITGIGTKRFFSGPVTVNGTVNYSGSNLAARGGSRAGPARVLEPGSSLS